MVKSNVALSTCWFQVNREYLTFHWLFVYYSFLLFSKSKIFATLFFARIPGNCFVFHHSTSAVNNASEHLKFIYCSYSIGSEHESRRKQKQTSKCSWVFSSNMRALENIHTYYWVCTPSNSIHSEWSFRDCCSLRYKLIHSIGLYYKFIGKNTISAEPWWWTVEYIVQALSLRLTVNPPQISITRCQTNKIPVASNSDIIR